MELSTDREDLDASPSAPARDATDGTGRDDAESESEHARAWTRKGTRTRTRTRVEGNSSDGRRTIERWNRAEAGDGGARDGGSSTTWNRFARW